MKLSVSQISDLNIPSEINPQIINRIFSSAATNLASTLQVIGVSSISIGVVPSLASTQHMISSYELFDDIPKELSTIASKIVPSIASYMSGFGIGAIKMSTEPEDVDNLKKLWDTIVHIDTIAQNENVNSEYTNNKELTVTPDPLPTTNDNNTIFRNANKGGCRRSSCGLKLNNKPQAPVITEDAKPTSPQPHLITVKEYDTNDTNDTNATNNTTTANIDNTDSTGGSATISNITNLTNIPPDVLQYIADVIKSNKRAEIKTVTVENSK